SRPAVPPVEPPRPTSVPTTLAQPVLIKRMPLAPTAAGASHREAGTIALNFEKATLRSVIDAVLGDALGLPYTVDERVDGVVTLVSPQKLSREEALEVLDGVLRMNGATLIKSDDLYRVMLAGNARQSLPGPRGGTDQPGYAITVYVARHTTAAALQRLIEPLYQIPGALSADPEHNFLLITGSAEERRALSDAARLFDQDWLAHQSVGIFPLHYAKPKALAEELRGVMTPPSGGASVPGGSPAPGSTVRITAIERLNSVMVVTLQPDDLDRAADWVTRLDQAGAGERRLRVYSVRYAKVQPLAKTLGRLFGSGGSDSGSSSLPPGTAGTRLSSAGAPAAPAGAGGPANGGLGGSLGGGSGGGGQAQGNGFGSTDHPLSTENGDTDQADSGAETSGGNGPRIVPDAASHTLMILATDNEYGVIEEALSHLDAKPAQILIEATIAEVTLNKTLQFGVQYYLRGAHLAGNNQGSLGFSGADAVGPLAQAAPGFNGVIGNLSNPSVILSALDAVTDSRVLSSPQLLVTDSHEAVLKVGTQTPLLTQQLSSTLTGTSTVNSVDYHDTGVILRVLPRSNDGDMVSLDIAQEVSQVVPTTTATLTPSITLRRIESSVTVQSGQTVMLGGLISESNSLTRDSIPGLGQIPLLGELFGNRDDNKTRTELVVFITPHVLRDEDQADRLTQELMGRLKELHLPSDSAR
ncbi:MAG TPA: type II secretion system secretin GspD, partial [Magnetospirillaceae bacterium]|nr:type II secretion system secretin GspD [Magnetospirillaceae bacterium]